MLTLLPQHEDTVIKRALEVRRLLMHTKEVEKHYPIMQEWEVKEYKAVFQAYKEELSRLVSYISERKECFDQVLESYGVNTETFLIHING